MFTVLLAAQQKRSSHHQGKATWPLVKRPLQLSFRVLAADGDRGVLHPPPPAPLAHHRQYSAG